MYFFLAVGESTEKKYLWGSRLERKNQVSLDQTGGGWGRKTSFPD